MIKSKAFIFDIDGTLADNSHRQHWVKSKPKNWKAYNKNMLQDTPITPVIDVLKDLAFRYYIIICTGREIVYSKETMAWLDQHKIPYTELHMRPKGDFRDDCIVKKEMLDTILEDYSVVGVFDDRTKVVNMWRENGCFVFDVNQTREEF